MYSEIDSEENIENGKGMVKRVLAESILRFMRDVMSFCQLYGEKDCKAVIDLSLE